MNNIKVVRNRIEIENNVAIQKRVRWLWRSNRADSLRARILKKYVRVMIYGEEVRDATRISVDYSMKYAGAKVPRRYDCWIRLEASSLLTRIIFLKLFRFKP